MTEIVTLSSPNHERERYIDSSSDALDYSSLLVSGQTLAFSDPLARLLHL